MLIIMASVIRYARRSGSSVDLEKCSIVSLMPDMNRGIDSGVRMNFTWEGRLSHPLSGIIVINVSWSEVVWRCSSMQEWAPIIFVKTRSKTLPLLCVLSLAGEARYKVFWWAHSTSYSERLEAFDFESQKGCLRLKSPAIRLIGETRHCFSAVITAPPSLSRGGL